MTNFVHRFKWQDIEKSAGDDIAKFLLKTWHRNNHQTTKELLSLTPKLLICGRPRNPDEPAPILISGNDALATRFFGLDWSERPDLAQEVMGAEYRQLVSGAYHDADASNEPVFDLVSTEIDGFALRYQRLILPFKAGSGLKYHYCYSLLLGDLPLAKKIPTDIYEPFEQLQTTHHCGSLLRADQ